MFQIHGRLSSIETEFKRCDEKIEKLSSEIKDDIKELRKEMKPLNAYHEARRLLDSNPQFISDIMGIPAPGNPYTKPEKEYLLQKYQNEQMTLEDANRLQEILNEDIDTAGRLLKEGNDLDAGDIIGAVIAIGIILLGLAALIAMLSRR